MVWLRLKNIKQELKCLNTQEFSNVPQKIKDARVALSKLQGQMRDNNVTQTLYEKGKLRKAKLEKWSTVKESILQKKS